MLPLTLRTYKTKIFQIGIVLGPGLEPGTFGLRDRYSRPIELAQDYADSHSFLPISSARRIAVFPVLFLRPHNDRYVFSQAVFMVLR